MTYAIIQIGGKQFWVQAGRFYDVNKIKANPGETILLRKVLLLNKNGEIQVGYPCIGTVNIKAKVLKHFKSRKVTVFKMKPKKNMKSKRGYRQDLTRLFIQEI
jgi:large subunit ribosomal protein L21